MFRSIQWRITLSFSLLVLIAFTVLGTYLVNQIRTTQLENLRTSLTTQASLIAETISPSLSDPYDTNSLKNEIARLGQAIEGRITVIDENGTVVGDSEEDASLMDNHANRPELKEALASGYGESTRYSTTLEYELMYVAVNVEDIDGVIGAVRIALPLTMVESMVNDVRTSIITAVVVTLFLVILSAWLAARILTRPVREVTEASKRIASGDLSQRIEVGSLDETGELARSFNQMSQKLAEMLETISEDRTRLESILDNIADGVIMTDTEGKVLLANLATGKIFSVRNRDIIDKPLVRILHDHELGELLERCRKTGKEQVEQFESTHFGRFLRAMVVPIKGRKTSGILFLIQDLTELRSLQTMRRELIGNISHDFRTPLAGIKAMVETLRDGAMDEQEIAEDFLSRIENEVDRLTQMVAELTELSRIETGRSELNIEYTGIDNLIGEAIKQLQPQADRKNLSIIREIQEGIPEVPVDPDRIRQVIINLLHNAIKFTEEKGTITVRLLPEEDMVKVEISDTGIGIGREDLPRIFERFYMADRSRAGGGTGMGLAIAKHVIEAHHGTIHAESSEGEGSTFSFTLPLSSTSRHPADKI